MKTYEDLPLPADGFVHPITTEQQLRRLNRITHVLWAHRDDIGPDLRITVAAEPSDFSAQIALHVHVPAEREDAERLAERLGIDTDDHEIHQGGELIHHRWWGMLDGFRARITWLEQVPAVIPVVTSEEEPDAVTTVGTCTGCTGEPGAIDDHDPADCPYALALRS